MNISSTWQSSMFAFDHHLHKNAWGIHAAHLTNTTTLVVPGMRMRIAQPAIKRATAAKIPSNYLSQQIGMLEEKRITQSIHFKSFLFVCCFCSTYFTCITVYLLFASDPRFCYQSLHGILFLTISGWDPPLTAICLLISSKSTNYNTYTARLVCSASSFNFT